MLTEKPRVLHVIARFNRGGTARYLENLLPIMADSFNTLLAVGQVQGREVEDSGLERVNFVRIKWLGRRVNIFRDFLAYLELRSVVKSFKPHIIHSHTFKAGLLARMMFFKVPKIHTFHGHLMNDPEFSKLTLKVIINVERCLATLTSQIVVVGKQISSDLLQVGVGKPSQYISIPSERPKLDFVSRQAAREKLQIDSGEQVILWMARMAPVKNPSLCLEVAQLLPEIQFLMAGEGDLFDFVKDQAPPNVQLLGWVNPEEIIPAADIFLSTSSNEGVPYSLIEALSAGLPVVAVNSGAVSEIIKHGINGVLTSAEPARLASQITNLLLNPKVRHNMVQSSLKLSVLSQLERKMISLHATLYKTTLNAIEDNSPHNYC